MAEQNLLESSGLVGEGPFTHCPEGDVEPSLEVNFFSDDKAADCA